jgi:hypothetical protein
MHTISPRHLHVPVNGTACNDNNNATFLDACFASNATCIGVPTTCGNQNVTCTPDRRMKYLSRCTPGSNCTAAACCRACIATELVRDGELGSPLPATWTNAGWGVGVPGYGGWDVNSGTNGATLSQSVC